MMQLTVVLPGGFTSASVQAVQTPQASSHDCAAEGQKGDRQEDIR
jgi:hypothetical protein